MDLLNMEKRHPGQIPFPAEPPAKKKVMDPSTKQDMDYILEELVGGNGWWQWKHLFLLIPTSLPLGLPLLLHMFAAFTPRHRCFVPGCDNDDREDGLFVQDFLDFAVPTDRAASSFLRNDEDYDPCLMYQVTDATTPETGHSQFTCSPERFSNETLVNCTQFVYDRSEFVATLTTEFDLVCDQVEKRHLIGSVMMMGLTLGSFLGGPLGDRIGRKGALFTAIFFAVPCLLLGGYVPNFELYILIKFVVCTAIVFGWIANHNLSVEFFGKSHRRLSYCALTLFGLVMSLALPLVAYLNRHWTRMHVASAVVAASALPVYFFLPESMRWLASNGRWREAEQILHDIARTNGRALSLADKAEVRRIVRSIPYESSSKGQGQGQGQGRRLSLLDLFRGPGVARRTVSLMFCWSAGILSYYVLILNVQALPGDIFSNYVLGQVAELPGIVFLFAFADYFGRRRCLQITYISLGLICLGMAFVPKEQNNLVLALYFLGKFSSSSATSLGWLYTSELYPTNLRSQAMGMCSMVSRIVGMTASYLSELSVYWKPLPMVLLGVPGILCGFLIMLLPETSGRSLPETMDQEFKVDLKDEFTLPSDADSSEDSESEEDDHFFKPETKNLLTA